MVGQSQLLRTCACSVASPWLHRAPHQAAASPWQRHKKAGIEAKSTGRRLLKAAAKAPDSGGRGSPGKSASPECFAAHKQLRKTAEDSARHANRPRDWMLAAVIPVIPRLTGSHSPKQHPRARAFKLLRCSLSEDRADVCSRARCEPWALNPESAKPLQLGVLTLRTSSERCLVVRTSSPLAILSQPSALQTPQVFSAPCLLLMA